MTAVLPRTLVPSLLCMAALSGCLITPVAPDAREPVPEPSVKAFDYVLDDPTRVAMTPPHDEGGDLRSIVATLPSSETISGPIEPVDVELYYHEGDPRPVVMLLPILGGRYDLERGLTRYMAENGFAGAMLKRRGKLLDAQQSMTQARAAFVGAVVDVRRTLDWLARRPEVQGDRVGLFGISRGGIVASLAAAVDPRVQAATLALAGGGIPTIIAHTNESEVVDFRDAQVRRLQSFDEFMRQAHVLLRDIDPLAHAHRLDPRRVLMLNAIFDTVIPRANQLALWSAAGKPTLYEFPVGHYGLVAFLWYCRAKARDHFQAILLQRSDVSEG
jgi:pimeloyl-ACP methyl ester carboxylesterase